MSEMNVTRRNFLSGAALVSAAIAGAGLAGCPRRGRGWREGGVP